MVQEILQYVPLAFQWARAQPKFKELYFVAIALGFATFAYTLTDPTPFHHPWKDVVASIWVQLRSVFATVGMISSAARIASESGVSPAGSLVTKSNP